MQWNKTWQPETMLALIGGILSTFFLGNLAAMLLHQTGAPGFKNEDGLGCVLLATLSFQGAAIVLGTAFLRLHDSSWRDVFGATHWKRCLVLACVALVITMPIMAGLKVFSDVLLEKLHQPVEEQHAVDLILHAKSPWLGAYMVIFAVVIAPVGEEFFFRGLLFSTAKHFGWRRGGWIGVSLLFALIHVNAPTFLPLFVLALALTWLYETTDGLLAPVLAHSLFNTANLVLLLLAGLHQHVRP